MMGNMGIPIPGKTVFILRQGPGLAKEDMNMDAFDEWVLNILDPA